LLDVSLDGVAHLWRRTEEPVGRNQARKPLVRPLEVVGVDVELQPPIEVLIVGKDGPREKLLPQRLPEPLDLAQGLRVLRPALDVPDALLPQLLLKLRRSPPGRVLPPVVSQDLPGRPVGGDASAQRLHHQNRLLMVGQGIGDDVTRVVVHEGRHVDPFVTPKEKREDVRLPHLVRLGTLETPRQMCPLFPRSHALDQPLLVEDPPHRALRDPKRLKPRQDVTDPPRAVLGMLLPHRNNGLPPRTLRLPPLGGRLPRVRHETVKALPLIGRHPTLDRPIGHTEGPAHLVDRCAVLGNFLNHPQPKLHRVARRRRSSPPNGNLSLPGNRLPVHRRTSSPGAPVVDFVGRPVLLSLRKTPRVSRSPNSSTAAARRQYRQPPHRAPPTGHGPLSRLLFISVSPFRLPLSAKKDGRC
jgi:hypothetical protein